MSSHRPSLKISLPMWVLAVLAALTVHAACFALARGYLRNTDPDAEMGAKAIELGIELVAPRSEWSELPAGPDAEESVASPAAEQVKIVEPVALPRDMSIESDDPELAVTQAETKKPVEDKPITRVELMQPSPEANASKATALPELEGLRPSTRSVAPNLGTGSSAQRVKATWQKELIAHFDQHKRYPEASHSPETAQAIVTFALDDSGRVLSAAVVRGSGDESFDEAALAMIWRSNPVPKPPAVVAQQGLKFTIPVIFRAKRVN
jgi:periplasmic protein TonB